MSMNSTCFQGIPNQTTSALPPSAVAKVTSDISYELRTPLTVIQGVLDLVSTGRLGPLSDHGQHMVSIAASNADRLLRLILAIEHEPESQVGLLSEEDLAQLQLATDLRSAVSRQELQLRYQPITSLSTGQVVGFEALLRWQHPSMGEISPDRFIPLAEKTGLILNIGLWVLREACEQLQRWQCALNPFHALYVSVNVSSKQLSQPDLVQQIEQILQETGLAAHSLKLEITESAVMENADIARTALTQLQTLGIEVYIDDFGTGYSCLSRLCELPLNVLKIDRAFVRQIASKNGKQLVQAIVHLARTIGADLIAEGVEDQEQVCQLQALGCERGQGYLFAKPMDSQDMTEFVLRSAVVP